MSKVGPPSHVIDRCNGYENRGVGADAQRQREDDDEPPAVGTWRRTKLAFALRPAQRRDVMGATLRESLILVAGRGHRVGDGRRRQPLHASGTGVTPNDVPTAALAVVILLIVAAVAAHLPARGGPPGSIRWSRYGTQVRPRDLRETSAPDASGSSERKAPSVSS